MHVDQLTPEAEIWPEFHNGVAVKNFQIVHHSFISIQAGLRVYNSGHTNNSLLMRDFLNQGSKSSMINNADEY